MQLILETPLMTLARIERNALSSEKQYITVASNKEDLAIVNFFYAKSSRGGLCLSIDEIERFRDVIKPRADIENFLKFNRKAISNSSREMMKFLNSSITTSKFRDVGECGIPSVGVLIRQWDSFKLTRQCLESLHQANILAMKNGELEVSYYLVDDASSDDSFLRLFLEFPFIKVVRMVSKVEYCLSFNILAEKAINEGCKYVFLVNNDTRNFSQNFLLSLVSTALNSNNLYSIVSPLVRGFDGASFFDGTKRDFAGINFPIATEAYLVSGELWRSINGFNLNLVRYCEDLDMLRRAGSLSTFVSADFSANLEHLGNGSSRRQVFVPTFFYVRNLFWIQKLYNKRIFSHNFYKNVFTRRIKPELRKVLREIVIGPHLRGFTRLNYLILALICGFFLNPKMTWAQDPSRYILNTKSRFFFRLK